MKKTVIASMIGLALCATSTYLSCTRLPKNART